MALDPANFISELIISGPGAPQGTEDISEGDDQIVTVKRATQQSFPNVDAAVTATAAEMNDQPEKLVDETIAGAWTFDGDLTMSAIISAVLDNAVALQGKEVDDVTIGDLAQINASDQVIIGNPVNDMFIDALFNMVARIAGVKVLSLAAAFNSSDVRFKVEGAEVFSGNAVATGSNNATLNFASPNGVALGFAATAPSNRLTITHNLGTDGFSDYVVAISSQSTGLSIPDADKLANSFEIANTVTNSPVDFIIHALN